MLGTDRLLFKGGRDRLKIVIFKFYSVAISSTTIATLTNFIREAKKWAVFCLVVMFFIFVSILLTLILINDLNNIITHSRFSELNATLWTLIYMLVALVVGVVKVKESIPFTNSPNRKKWRMVSRTKLVSRLGGTVHLRVAIVERWYKTRGNYYLKLNYNISNTTKFCRYATTD